MNRFDRISIDLLQKLFAVFHISPSREKLESLLQVMKFCLVGFMNTIISYGTYVVFVALGVHYLLSSGIAFVVSTSNAYFWNNRYVFAGKETWWLGLLKTFCAYGVTGVILYNFLLYLLVEICGISEFLSPLFVLLVTIPCNFIINKYWTYRKRK